MAWEHLQPLLSPILSHFTAGQLRSPKNCPVCLSPRSSRLLLIPVHWWSFWLHESNESQWRFFFPSLPVHTGAHSLQRCSCLLGFLPGLFLSWSTSGPSARSTESADILQCSYFSQLLMLPKPTPLSRFSFLCDHLTRSYLLRLLLTEEVRKLAWVHGFPSQSAEKVFAVAPMAPHSLIFSPHSYFSALHELLEHLLPYLTPIPLLHPLLPLWTQ